MKKREHEARMAQKKLEEEKARKKYEEQMIISKQERNADRLGTFIKDMNLNMLRGGDQFKEDFNTSLSFLSLYFTDFLDNFSYYS